MSVGEISTPLCQGIHVRSDRLGMAPEKTGPVIEIVDADQQDVGTFNCAGGTGENQEKD
jgi:hypothetical protein